MVRQVERTPSGKRALEPAAAEFDDNSVADLIQMSTSSDGGLTWGAALPTADHAHGIGGQPLVQPGGTVIVPIEGFATRNGGIMSFISTNGGGRRGARAEKHPRRLPNPPRQNIAGILPPPE